MIWGSVKNFQVSLMDCRWCVHSLIQQCIEHLLLAKSPARCWDRGTDETELLPTWSRGRQTSRRSITWQGDGCWSQVHTCGYTELGHTVMGAWQEKDNLKEVETDILLASVDFLYSFIHSCIYTRDLKSHIPWILLSTDTASTARPSFLLPRSYYTWFSIAKREFGRPTFSFLEYFYLLKKKWFCIYPIISITTNTIKGKKCQIGKSPRTWEQRIFIQVLA